MIYYVTRAQDEIYFVTSQPEDASWMTPESWSAKGSLEELRSAFSAFHPEVRAVLDACPDVYKWALLERDPLPTWRQGRVVLARRRLSSDDALHGAGRGIGSGGRCRSLALS